MAFTGTDIKNKALLTLVDDGTRWSDATLVSFINDCFLELIVVAPFANAQINTVQLDVGCSQFHDGYLLMDVIANTDSDGIDGEIIRKINKATLDFTNPTWAQSKRKSIVKYYAPNPDVLDGYYVYPPSDGTNYINIKVAAYITPLTAISGAINLRNQFMPAIVDYVCYKAYNQDTDASNQQIALGYYQNFINKIQMLTGQPQPTQNQG